MASNVNNKFDNIWNFLSEHEIQTVLQIQSNLICMLCNKILINAKQTPCGCRFCLNCITHYLDGGTKICPGQSEYCIDYMLNLTDNILADNSANREIGKLIIKCPNDCCEVENELRLVIDHLLICSYTLTSCLRCNVSIQNKDVEYHNSSECEHRISHCHFCKDNFDHKILIEQHWNIEHDTLCDKLVALCPNHCEETLPIRLKQHFPVCSNRPEPCLFKSLGCELVINRNTVSKHLETNNAYHSKMLLNHIDNLQNDISTLKHENETKSQEIIDLKLKLTHLDTKFESKHNDFIWKLEKFSQIKTDFVTSKPFLTSRFGYKMCLKLWPFGVVQTPPHWVALYCVLMHGQYDELLPTVFPHKVIVSLLGPGGTEKYTKCIRSGSMDREFGIKEFIEYDELVNDRSLLFNSDSIYIRCTVV